MAEDIDTRIDPGSPRLALVTGGTGAVGLVVVRRLLAAGYRVRTLTWRETPPGTIPDEVAWYDGDNLPVNMRRVKRLVLPTRIDAEAIRDYGFEQRIASEDGLRKTVQYYCKMATSK